MPLPITFTRPEAVTSYWTRTPREWKQNYNLYRHLCDRFGIRWWEW